MKDTSQTKKAGVNGMGLNLYEHNEKAYKSAVAMMQQYGNTAKPPSFTPPARGKAISPLNLLRITIKQ